MIIWKHLFSVITLALLPFVVPLRIVVVVLFNSVKAVLSEHTTRVLNKSEPLKKGEEDTSP